jgi:integrase
MKLENKSDYTINFTRKALNTISKYTDLDKPQEVKMFIALHKASDGYKRNLCIAYNKFCKYYKISWNMPTYHPESKGIKIPTKEKIEMLIASAKKPTSIKLQISKETGLRPIELCNLRVKDLDLEQNSSTPPQQRMAQAKSSKSQTA